MSTFKIQVMRPELLTFVQYLVSLAMVYLLSFFFLLLLLITYFILLLLLLFLMILTVSGFVVYVFTQK